MSTSFNIDFTSNSELSSTQASGLSLLEQHNSRQLYLERLASYTVIFLPIFGHLKLKILTKLLYFLYCLSK